MLHLKSTVQTILPKPARELYIKQRDALLFRVAGAERYDTSALLRGFGAADLAQVFRSPEIDREWAEIAPVFDALDITTSAGGVNAGDRRAIYYLIRHFRPQSMLEVGTHIGASTVHIAAALLETARQDAQAPGTLTTVDIVDVNDPIKQPWIENGSTSSPRAMTGGLGAGEIVTYVTKPSLEFIKSATQRFDFCFLDGDHSAKAVYPELAAATRLLNPGGVILLHDYFPGNQPLWVGGRHHAGPWQAAQRLISEGAEFTVLPLGALPWPTKLGSNMTSLALVVHA
jgi:predicted O-methyltransferase YrrM